MQRAEKGFVALVARLAACGVGRHQWPRVRPPAIDGRERH
jgi:hypothetical protein